MELLEIESFKDMVRMSTDRVSYLESIDHDLALSVADEYDARRDYVMFPILWMVPRPLQDRIVSNPLDVVTVTEEVRAGFLIGTASRKNIPISSMPTSFFVSGDSGLCTLEFTVQLNCEGRGLLIDMVKVRGSSNKYTVDECKIVSDLWARAIAEGSPRN